MKQALHKSEIPASRIFEVRQLREKHFDPVWHAHSEFQLFVVLEGTGTRFIGDSIKSFKPGELLLTGPHLPHLWRSDETYFDKKGKAISEGIVIYFHEHFLGEHMMEKEELNALKKLFSRAMYGLEFFGETREKIIGMMKQLTRLKGINSVIHLLHILENLARSHQYQLISSVTYQDTVNEAEAGRMNLVYEYVMKNFRQKIALNQMADLVNMTPTSFSRYFTMRNNKPFSRFLSEIRIKHACQLLAETEETIEHICYDSGFHTLSNFNKQFKEIMGKQPTQYKKEIGSL